MTELRMQARETLLPLASVAAKSEEKTLDPTVTRTPTSGRPARSQSLCRVET
jgi:hypothetical protein